ncbi:protein TRC8 homolog [Nephila pilipes]|uniref:Protein TRC8 homolog n=1 Tax=Nephila pilipes TaxID=299642 RepID=A0A8X6N2H8_NEPPI|nr:protein TRC8 homolog [Nephila pilipes]
MICNSKRCVTLDGWLISKKLINFTLHIPVYLKSDALMNHLPLPDFEDATYFMWQTLGFLLAVVLITQKTHHLIAFYLSVAALGVIIWSYILNVEYVKYCSELLFEHSSLQHELFSLNKKAVQVFFCSYMSQSFLSIIFCFSTMNIPDFTRKKFMVGVLFIFPTLINAALPSTVLMIAPDFVAVAIFGILICHFMRHLPMLPNCLWLFVAPWNFSFQFVRLLNMFAIYWTDLKITKVFQTFALLRLIKNIILFYYVYIFKVYYETGLSSFDSEQLVYIFKQLMLMSFENFVAMCGITSILAFFIDTFVNDVIQKFLMVPDVEQNSISCMFSQLLILLCVQFGVTSLESEERIKMIFNISWMMGISVLSRINLQICQKLVCLSAMGNASYKKHARTLIVAFLTLVISSSWLTFIFKSYLSETWLFPVTIFNIEILISLIITLIIYVLNLIHYHCCTVWYELYDYIYYLQSLKNVVTLILAVVVFVKGFYKLFESGSILRLLFLFVHFYHNVWCQLVLGWNLWKQRRLIYHCVNSLPIATIEEVTEMGGCCAICLNDVMKHIVCITRCNHFFHCYCLRKWLNERKTCPICHRIILSDTRETVHARERRRLHSH